MINEIINNISTALKADDFKSVYSAFDSTPYNCKKNEVSMFVSLSDLKTISPIYSPNLIFVPFNSTVSITVTAPPQYSANILYDFFENVVLPRLNDSCYNIWSMKSLSIKPDTNLNKLSLKSEFYISGIYQKERVF